MKQFSSVAYLLAFSHDLIFAVNRSCGDDLGKTTKKWIGKNECSKKLQQKRLEYLFNYFIVIIMKAHDER